jgi:hypothetical protein
VTAPGEDILAYLDRVITAREEAARAVGFDTIEAGDYLWNAKYLVLRRGDESKAAPEMDAGLADHIALNDPASVLRRCAADRKMLNLHGRRHHSCPTLDDNGDPDFTEFYDHEACPIIQLLAEGYGWTEGER